jgi:hypothetical protein
VASLGCECQSYGSTDTTAGSGNQNDFALKVLHLSIAGEVWFSFLQESFGSFGQIVSVCNPTEGPSFEFKPSGQVYFLAPVDQHLRRLQRKAGQRRELLRKLPR